MILDIIYFYQDPSRSNIQDIKIQDPQMQ